MKRLASCWIGLLLCAAASFAQATDTWTVTSTGSGGTCTANSTTDPNCTLDAAIADSSDGDTVLFASAIQGSTICCSFSIANGLTIDGGSNGMILDGGGFGIVVYISSGVVNLRHLTLRNGLGDNSGGGIYITGGNLTLDSCTVSHNTAAAYGAGIFTANGTSTTIINSTIADNTVTSVAAGGGIYANGNLVITNSTIAGNAASGSSPYGYGGGVFTAATLTLSSSIIAGNTATGGAPDIYGIGTQVSLGYNIVGNTSLSGLNPTTGDQFGVDPLFTAAGPANNGGATQTMALQSQSPARSGGNCAGNESNPSIPAVTLDQIGQTRSTPCTVGALDMTSIFYNGFE